MHLKNFVLRLPCLGVLVLSLLAELHASVVPVPSSIEVQRLQGQKPRNVVFILADDHRYDALSFMGNPLVHTPSLDRLAREGAHLRKAMVTTSLCSPSRASILTGLYTFRHRVIDNNRPIPKGSIFFPQYLKQAGYSTAFIGKWHMGGEDDSPQPGFDHWVSFKGQGAYLPPNSPYALNVNGKRVPQKGYLTDELTDYALEWIKQQNGTHTPFFLYLSHKAIHANFTPAERHRGSLKDRKWVKPTGLERSSTAPTNTPRWVRDQRNSWHGADFPYHSELDIEDYYRSYGETLCAVDEGVGRILEQLETMGIADDTLVIYMGDNGFLFGEHGLIDKRVAYEESIRVPLLMRCPKLFKGGLVIDQIVANIDIAPTIMEAMGLAPAAHFDGRSTLPLLRGETTDWRKDFLYVYYWEKNFPQSPTVFSLRGERYKYITYYGLWDADELYDLSTDPREQTNLLFQPGYAALAAKLEAKLYTLMEELGGMEIPLNAPAGRSSNLRLRQRGGEKAAEFPAALVVDKAENEQAK